MPIADGTDKRPDHGPGLLRVLGRSPAALAGYLGLHKGLEHGALNEAERCLIGLTVAQRSGSAYWLSVQSRLAEQAGLTKGRIGAAREGCADSQRHTALLFLAGKLVINRGELPRPISPRSGRPGSWTPTSPRSSSTSASISPPPR